MAKVVSVRRNRRKTLMLALLTALLALLAVALWYLSMRFTAPLSGGGSPETEGFTYLSSVYGYGSDRLHRPAETAVDKDGNVYVTDSFKHRVVVFDSNGAFVRTIGGPAKVEGALKYPTGIAVDPRGRVYVVSTNAGKIVIFNPNGSIFRQVFVKSPLSITIVALRLYVTTSKGILIGDLDGNQMGQLSGFGFNPGRINRATGLAVDEQGTIYLADSLNYRFQAIDRSGKPLWAVGKPPNPKTAVTDRSRTFGLPVSLELASDGLLYGLDAFNGEIVVLTKEGERVAEYGTVGRQDGEFYYPSGISQVSGEKFVIADTYNDRLQFVNIPSAAPGLVGQGRRACPWLIPLLLLAALLSMLRRPVALVLDEAGLRRAEDMGVVSQLVEMRSALHVPVGTVDKCRDVIERHPDIESKLREIEPDERISTGDELVDIALTMRGRLGLRRSALVYPHTEQAKLAEEYGVGILESETPGGASVPAT